MTTSRNEEPRTAPAHDAENGCSPSPRPPPSSAPPSPPCATGATSAPDPAASASAAASSTATTSCIAWINTHHDNGPHAA